MKICVTSNRGPRGEETPWAFYVGVRRLHVAAVLERWTDAVYRYFEVCVDDGRRFVLRLEPSARIWELVAVFAASARRTAPKAVTSAAPRKFFSTLTPAASAKSAKTAS